MPKSSKQFTRCIYAQIATQLEALYVEDLQQIDNQAVALRLVHFVDKLYDQEVRLSVSLRMGLALGEIFSAAYRHGGYEKKYRRCLSRLHELVSETRVALLGSTSRAGVRDESRYSTNAP